MPWVHQNAFKAGPKPINSTELETYRCQHTWIELPTWEVKTFCVWLHMANILKSLPNKNLAHNIWKLPARPLPVFHSRHYRQSAPWVSSSRAYLTGSTPAGLQACLNYTARHAAKKPKPVLEPVKPPSATPFSEYEQLPMVQPYIDSSGSTHFCVAQAYKGALCSHRMVCKICSECCPPSHCKSRYKNRFSSSAGFPLPIFKLMQSLTLIIIAVIAVSVYCWLTLWSLARQRQSLLWKVQPSVFTFGYRHSWKQQRVLVQKEHFWKTWKARRTLYPCSVSGKSTMRQVALLQLPGSNKSLFDTAFLPSIFFSNLAIRQKALETVLDSFIMEQKLQEKLTSYFLKPELHSSIFSQSVVSKA